LSQDNSFIRTFGQHMKVSDNLKLLGSQGQVHYDARYGHNVSGIISNYCAEAEGVAGAV
jgi:hypothetical protein